MTHPFRLGFLTHVENVGDPRRVYRETLELFVAADALGFDVGWVAQHHFKSQTACLPSPFPFLAAAAERTRHIRLGTSIVVVPLEQPLRVAEDAAVVDALSGGRLELGIGSGGDAEEFKAFGRDISQRLPLTSDGVNGLQCALRGEPLGPTDLRLQPPAPTLNDRLWQSALSVVGAQHVAQHGAGLMLSRAAWSSSERTDRVQLPVAQAYLDTWDAPQPPRIALSRGVYLAADKRAALVELREPIGRYAETLAKRGQFPSNLTLEQYCERLYLFYGNPEEIAAELKDDLILPYSNDVIIQFNPVTPPLDQAIRMLEQFAWEVAPALGWKPRSSAKKPSTTNVQSPYLLHPAVI